MGSEFSGWFHTNLFGQDFFFFATLQLEWNVLNDRSIILCTLIGMTNNLDCIFRNRKVWTVSLRPLPWQFHFSLTESHSSFWLPCSDFYIRNSENACVEPKRIYQSHSYNWVYLFQKEKNIAKLNLNRDVKIWHWYCFEFIEPACDKKVGNLGSMWSESEWCSIWYSHII